MRVSPVPRPSDAGGARFDGLERAARSRRSSGGRASDRRGGRAGGAGADDGGGAGAGGDDDDDDSGSGDEGMVHRIDMGGAARRYSYASLEEYMVHASLRRSLGRRHWSAVAPLAFGWLANWALMLALLAVVSAYGCEFYASLASGDGSETFLLSWGWSVAQRFLVNEPALILAQKGIPMLFASNFCEHFFSESFVSVLALVVEGVVSFMKTLRAASAA